MCVRKGLYVCVCGARASSGPRSAFNSGCHGVRGQPVSCTYQGERMTDSKARMRDLSDCEFSVSFAQRSAFIKVVKSGLILVRHVVAFNECYCFAASLWCCVYCSLHLPFFLKSNPSFSLFPVLCGSRRAPHTLFLTVLNVFSLLCAACCSRKINRLINMRA